MLRKEHLRVSRAGGEYRPRFTGREHRSLAARLIELYRDHVGEPRGELDVAVTALERGELELPDQSGESRREREPDEFKLVRGFAALLDRETTIEVVAPVDPERARRATFEAAEAVGVVTEDDRAAALIRASESLGLPADDLADAFYADLDSRQIVTDVDARWDPDELVAQYNLSLAQTALFDATEVRVRSSDPRRLISAVKRLRLLYEVRKTGDGGDGRSDREVIVTGPTHLFRATRRYGTRFARLLRSVATADSWHIEATIDDRGTERTMVLTDDDPVGVPDTEPVADVSYDSAIEADFAARFSGLDLPWELVREPEPLVTGTRVMIPDFTFEYRYGDVRVYFEIMGFWTPEYVEKKLAQLAGVEDVDVLVAVDESLGVGETIEAGDHRAIPYTGSVRIKDVADVLGEYEADLVTESAAALPDEFVPDADVLTLGALAEREGVDAAALEAVTFPEHERVGRTLIRPALVDSLADEIEEGMSLSAVEAVLESEGVTDASALLSRLGYRVEWEGLSGGTVVER